MRAKSEKKFFGLLLNERLLNCIILTLIYFCIPEILKTNFSNRFLSRKSSFEFVFSSCEFTKVFCSKKAGVKCSY